jgi:ligand-binding sensor domain-containing protein
MINKLIKVKYLGLLAMQCFLLLTRQVCAQMSLDNYEQYTVKDGLPSQVIYAVLQDKNGFLWISTDAGVSRFDGKNFVNYTTKDGLGDNEVLDIFEDNQGRIWFKPFMGRLSYYQNQVIYSDHNDALLAAIKGRYANNSVLCEDALGNIYIASSTSASIAILRPGHKLDFLDIADKLGQDVIKDIFTSSDKKHVYCHTREGQLLRITNSNVTLVKQRGKRRAFFSVYSSKEVLYLDDKGLYSVQDSTFRLLIPARALLLDNTQTINTDIQMDQQRNIWICNSRARTVLYRYIDGKYESPILVLENANGSLLSFDREQNIWLYDKRNGLFKLPYNRLLDKQVLGLNKPLLQKQVISCFVDSWHNLWLGYNNGWVTRLDQHGAAHFDLNPDKRRTNRILQMVEDRDGVLWFATDAGLCAIKQMQTGQGFSVTIRRKSHYAAGKHVFTDTAGNAYSVNVSNVMWTLNFANDQICSIPYRILEEDRLFAAFFSRENALYTSDRSGVKLQAQGRWRKLYMEDKRLGNRIQHFAESGGCIFMATYDQGLIATKNGRILTLAGMGNTIAGTICRRIYVYRDTLYVATNAGISTLVFEKDSFHLIHNIRMPDGLLSNDVFDLSFRDNTLYAATSGGLSVIPLPLRPQQQAAPPVPSILGVRIDGRSYLADKPLDLSYKDRQIQITFVSPVMTDADAVSYRYRFAGKDKNWVLTTGNQIEYRDLPFGNYRLEVQARKYNSAWSHSVQVGFTIHPPWYLRWWFVCAVVVFVVIVAYGWFVYVVRIKVRRTLREREVIENERSRIAAELHDDIGGDLTHMILLSDMLKHKNERQDSLIDRLGNSSQEIVSKLNEIVWMLNSSHDTLFGLVSYLNQYAERMLETAAVASNIQIAEEAYSEIDITSEFRRNVFLVFKESLHNIVRHSGADHVMVHIFTDKPGSLVIYIQDNGKGFDPGKNYMGNGLNNMKKRIYNINGSLQLQAAAGEGCSVKINVRYEK